MSFLTSPLVAVDDGGDFTIHDDFEGYADDAGLQSAWNGPNATDATLETGSPVEGSQSVTSTSSQTYITDESLTSADDEFWSIDVQYTDGGADTVGLMLHVQDNSGAGNVIDDCVRIRMDLQDNDVDVAVYENGSTQATSNPSTGTLSTGTRYRIGGTITSGGDIATEVYDVDSNTQLVDDTLAYDPSWDTGIPGIYFQNSGLAAADYVRSGPGPELGLQFDDSTPDYVVCPSDAEYSGLAQMTVSFWMRPADVSNRHTLVGKYDTNNNQRSWYVESNGGDDIWAFISSDGSSFSDAATGAGVLSLDTLHHVAAAYDPPTVTIFVDGTQEVQTDTGESAIYDNTGGALEFGRATYSTGREYAGGLRDVKIHDFVFDATDASQVASGTPITSGVVGYWPLDAIDSGTVIDEANGNNGTVNGSPEVVLMDS